MLAIGRDAVVSSETVEEQEERLTEEGGLTEERFTEEGSTEERFAEERLAEEQSTENLTVGETALVDETRNRLEKLRIKEHVSDVAMPQKATKTGAAIPVKSIKNPSGSGIPRPLTRATVVGSTCPSANKSFVAPSSRLYPYANNAKSTIPTKSIEASTSSTTKKFDLKESLKRPLSYKPYSGMLMSHFESNLLL